MLDQLSTVTIVCPNCHTHFEISEHSWQAIAPDVGGDSNSDLLLCDVCSPQPQESGPVVFDHRTLPCTCGIPDCHRVVHLGLIDGVEHVAIDVECNITTPWTPLDRFGVQGEWLYGPDAIGTVTNLAHLDDEARHIFQTTTHGG